MEAVTTVFRYKKFLILLALAVFGLMYFGFLQFSFTVSQQVIQIVAFLLLIMFVTVAWKERKGGKAR